MNNEDFQVYTGKWVDVWIDSAMEGKWEALMEVHEHHLKFMMGFIDMSVKHGNMWHWKFESLHVFMIKAEPRPTTENLLNLADVMDSMYLTATEGDPGK